jgi:hypothetical protein
MLKEQNVVNIAVISIFALGFIFTILYLTGVFNSKDVDKKAPNTVKSLNSAKSPNSNSILKSKLDNWNFHTKYPSFYEGSLFLLNPVYAETMRYRSLEDPDNPMSYTSWGAPDCKGVQETQIRELINSLIRIGKFNPTKDVIVKSLHFIINNGYWPIINQLSQIDQVNALKQIFDHISKTPQPPQPPHPPQPNPHSKPNISGSTWTDVNKKNLKSWMLVQNIFINPRVDFAECVCESLQLKYTPDQFIVFYNIASPKDLPEEYKTWFISTMNTCMKKFPRTPKI